MKYVIYICTSKGQKDKNLYKVGQSMISSGRSAVDQANKRVQEIKFGFEGTSLEYYQESHFSDKVIHRELIKKYKHVGYEWFESPSLDQLKKDTKDIIDALNLSFVEEEIENEDLLFFDKPENYQVIEGQTVILDEDVAKFFKVTTKHVNQSVKRHISRFPKEFMFRIQTMKAKAPQRGGRRFLPYAFTKQGCMMLAMILTSDKAKQVSVEIIKSLK